jgi:hypothetical protein
MVVADHKSLYIFAKHFYEKLKHEIKITIFSHSRNLEIAPS